MTVGEKRDWLRVQIDRIGNVINVSAAALDKRYGATKRRLDAIEAAVAEPRASNGTQD
jgi:hypothetical protein